MGFDDTNRHSPDGGLWDRFSNSMSGGSLFRTIVRIIALFSALVILGLNKIQCSLNFLGNNNLNFIQLIGLFFDAMVYGYSRASILLWQELENFTIETLTTNWGDFLILGLFSLFVFTALYSTISIFSDFFDGSPKDKSPTYIKFMITLAFMLVFSASLFYFSEKPSDNYYVNSGLLLTNEQKQVCIETGEVPFFISQENNGQDVNIIDNQNNNVTTNTSIGNDININNTQNNNTQNNEELINMLN